MKQLPLQLLAMSRLRPAGVIRGRISERDERVLFRRAPTSDPCARKLIVRISNIFYASLNSQKLQPRQPVHQLCCLFWLVFDLMDKVMPRIASARKAVDVVTQCVRQTESRNSSLRSEVMWSDAGLPYFGMLNRGKRAPQSRRLGDGICGVHTWIA